jgi:ferrochelatase
MASAPVGVLLIQLGTPDAPTARALRRYLRQFLSDPRVIELPRWQWLPIFYLFVLPFRPAQSAAKYRRIWQAQTGSPLLHWTRRQAALVQEQLPHVPVRFAMQIGNPPVAKVVEEMIQAGIERLLVLPLYPQYSATTTASALDALFQALQRQRRVPALRVVPPYYDHPAYLEAVTAVIRDELARLSWEPEHYLLSFHGLPVRYVQRGDPYPQQVQHTAAALRERLHWPEGRWTLTFQSRFGREEWLRPYTDETLCQLARQGVRRVFVAMPGFTADCLETLDEIGNEARHLFQQAGGAELRACPCLNDHPRWIEALATLLRQEGQGWL